MAKVVVGFGVCKGYRLTEVPEDVLKTIAERFPLEIHQYDISDTQSLVITVAVHEELSRRANGGLVQRHLPSRRELAQGIVKEGFRQLSKTHHPDRNGHEEAQKRLAAARDQLQALCAEIPDQFDGDTVFVSDSKPDVDDFYAPVTDDDIPF